MPNKMLIDATHPEETRVVVVRGNRVEEFDFETAQRKQLRGNIYLAKVTRVEPSLQAAFVEYGGNRHGFLAFSEIHPDYYQIPVADRQALLEEEAMERRDEEEEEEAPTPMRPSLVSANHSVEAARASFFPSIGLTAQNGVHSAALASLFGPGAWFYTATASITQPIFDGGNLGVRRRQLHDIFKRADYDALTGVLS